MYLKYLYKFETLVLYEVLPLRLDAAIPAPLPLLETLSRAASELLAAPNGFSFEDFRHVSSNTSGAGNAASSRRGSTSKGTRVSNLYTYFNNFLTIPRIFGSHNIYLIKKCVMSASNKAL